MGLHKSTRMKIILGIDTAFFFLEIIVGYAVHSLALVADAFHMLNDIISLLVGLWAIQVATKQKSTKYTYGWQRAEILGGLVNSIFLIALCLTIFLEAIQRLIEVPDISNPKLVLIVGCCGLASNIVGLFLFHDHGHNHGGEEEEHGHTHDELNDAETGYGSFVDGDFDRTAAQVADESGNVVDVLPQSRIGNWPILNSPKRPAGDSDDFISPTKSRKRASSQWSRKHTRSTSRGSRGIEELPTHPGSLRKHFLEAAGTLRDIESVSGTDTENEEAVSEVGEGGTSSDRSPLLKKSKSKNIHDGHSHSHNGAPQKDDISHSNHHHTKPRATGKKRGHGHSHDMNIRGVFLHVLGDALGNVGVISAALIIWLTDWRYRFYADPAISLIITMIILASAIPLCKGASRILLQAVPEDIDVDQIKEDITSLPGVVGCHHLHVWQLTDQKHVASLHVQVAFDLADNCNEKYMNLARTIRSCLHAYGIHSSTIQPEFRTDGEYQEHFHHHRSDDDCENPTPPGSLHSAGGKGSKNSKTASVRSRSESGGCLLECGNECKGKNMCCAPVQDEVEEDDGHGHGHHGH